MKCAVSGCAWKPSWVDFECFYQFNEVWMTFEPSFLAPFDPFWAILDPIWGHFGPFWDQSMTILGWFGGDFGPFLGRSGVTLGSLGVHFGIVLGSFWWRFDPISRLFWALFGLFLDLLGAFFLPILAHCLRSFCYFFSHVLGSWRQY